MSSCILIYLLESCFDILCRWVADPAWRSGADGQDGPS